MKLGTKTILVVVAAATLFTSAFAAATFFISGYLSPGMSQTWGGTFGPGWHDVTVDGVGYGDLDVYVYGPYGELLAYDALPGNHAYVQFYTPYVTGATIVVQNDSGFHPVSYSGVAR
jgi:hypothetical protein